MICVELRNLNDPCVTNPFPIPFNDEVLDDVGGQEVYSFIDGFSGYHKIRIAKEDVMYPELSQKNPLWYHMSSNFIKRCSLIQFM